MRGEVARVQLKYQLVVHSCCCPASGENISINNISINNISINNIQINISSVPDIESEEEDDEDAEHGTAVQPRHNPPVAAVQVEVP